MAADNPQRKFAVFILTHGRANNILTLANLRKHGYTGRIVLVIDNEDAQASEYYRLYGHDDVVMFDKAAEALTTDAADLNLERTAILWARNASFQIAKNLGLTHFIQLDDDIKQFMTYFLGDGTFLQRTCRKLDQVFASLCDFIDTDPRIITVCISQAGDYIGGKDSDKAKCLKLWRKAMNSFVCRTDRPFKWFGRMNEDVSTYTLLGSQGKLMFTFPGYCLIAKLTQQNQGGITEAYCDTGTYQKSMYSVMYHPSSVKIHAIGWKNYRIHHQVRWANTVPLILNQKYKKQ